MLGFRRKKVLAAGGVAVVATAVVATAIAAGGRNYDADLSGFGEVPVVSTTGHGDLTLRKAADGQSLEYELSYSDVEGDVTQAHIHLGAARTNGGVAVWLCSNLASPPTPAGLDTACPKNAGTVTGTIEASDIVGPTGQGLAATEIEELLTAIARGVTYVNVHSTKVGSGEIRGQIGPGSSN